MKLLRNPVVVGLLAVVAVLVVFHQVFGTKLLRSWSAGKASVTATKKVTPAKKSPPPRAATTAKQNRKASSSKAAVTQTNLDETLLPDQEVDAAYIAERFPTWANAPLRDPFMLLSPAVEDPAFFAGETNSPVPSWTLHAIWNQTDSRLAVVNDRVQRVGDVIEGYELIQIGNDEVWFRGPWRNERLGFAEPQKGPPPGKAKRPKAKTAPRKS